MFKKTKIAAATVALLGLAAVQNASAVAIDESGSKAQVLIFPYYNTNNGFSTAFNIRNTKNEVKAVKIRLRESKLSNDVLDFNVYMSPFDHFSFTVAPDSSGKAVLSTADTTCTYPAIPAGGEPLKGDVYKYTNATDAREGYVEVIEMGVVTDATVSTGVTHVSGKPKDCSVVAAAWGSGVFTEGGANAVVNGANDTTRVPKGIKVPSGGIQGWSFLVDLVKGSANVAIPAAIRNYQTAIAQHYVSDNVKTFLLPSLASGNVTKAELLDDATGSTLVNPTFPTATDYVLTTPGKTEVALANNGVAPDASGINPYPLSYVLSATAVSNDYIVTGLTKPDSTGTDWVITFPMRKHGIFSTTATTTNATTGDISISDSSTPTNITIGGSFFDREETKAAVGGGAGFSPVASTPADKLTREVNILSFGLKGATTASRVLNSSNTKNYDVPYQAGWGTIAFTSSFVSGGQDLKGVPTIGFAALHGNIPGGFVIGESVPHNFTRNR